MGSPRTADAVGTVRTLRLATRGSPLARRQTETVAALLRAAHPGLEVEPVVVRTRGDRDASVPLDQIGGQGVFVAEVEAAVADGRADAAVHSAKDMPSVMAASFVLGAVPPRADPRDALVGCRLAELPAGALIATGSARRRAQLAYLRPDLVFRDLRGNMARRVAAAGTDGVTAVVVAMAAMERLEWLDQVTDVLDPMDVLPQAGQGAIAVQCRAGDEPTPRRWLPSTTTPPTAPCAPSAPCWRLSAGAVRCRSVRTPSRRRRWRRRSRARARVRQRCVSPGSWRVRTATP